VPGDPVGGEHSSGSQWAARAVVYQVYPRSFQDSDGDGIGDLEGVRSRLEHLRWLGVDALWLSPIYPSPLADGGYDVSDHTDVDPRLGTLADFDALAAEAKRLGLRVLLDLVPNHTSIEHPWFREHADWYVWSDDGPPNNWLSAFGGPAWSRDEVTGRWYLHSFYPEQPDLNWRNPEVPRAIGDVVRFWRDRGVDGFRVDAVDRIAKDPRLRDDVPATGPWLLPLPPEYATLEHVHSRNADDIGDLLRRLRDEAGDATLVGEVYRPTAQLEPFLANFDLVFAFEFMFASWRAEEIARVVEPAARLARVAWVLSNHDNSRLASRVGEENLRLAAVLLLTLPGAAFVYQGDEIGLRDGPGAYPPFDRAGRDGARHPMQWDASPSAGFTTGDPWLPPVDPEHRNVEDEKNDPRSLLGLYRRLVALRRTLPEEFEIVSAADNVLVYRRGDHLVTLNFGEDVVALPGSVVLTTDEDDSSSVAAQGAAVTRLG
jgi:alpha-glucosidase